MIKISILRTIFRLVLPKGPFLALRFLSDKNCQLHMARTCRGVNEQYTALAVGQNSCVLEKTTWYSERLHKQTVIQALV